MMNHDKGSFVYKGERRKKKEILNKNYQNSYSNQTTKKYHLEWAKDKVRQCIK